MNRYNLALAVAVVAVALSGAPSARAESASSLPLTTISQITATVDMSANIPRAAALDTELEARLREDIEADFAEMRNQAAQDFTEFGDESFWNPYALSIDWTERLVSSRFISLLATRYAFTGGAHGNTDLSSVLWDREQSRELGLPDLLQDARDGGAALQKIVAYLRFRLIREKMTRLGVSEQEARNDPGIDALEAKAELLETYTLMPSDRAGKAGGVLFHFPPYLLGAFAEGSYELAVPYKILAPLLRPGIRRLFSGNAVQMRSIVSGTEPGLAILLANAPRGDTVRTPLLLEGEAPDFWFEDRTARVEIRGGDDKLLGAGDITADPGAPVSGTAIGMVRFSGTIAFKPLAKGEYGKVVFLRGPGEGVDGERMKIEWWVTF